MYYNLFIFLPEDKKHDVFKHALSGLLRLEGEEDDRAIGGTGEETITSTVGQRRVGSESQLSEVTTSRSTSVTRLELPVIFPQKTRYQ